jgi:hypothetical protein
MTSFTERNYIIGLDSGADYSALTNDDKYIALQLDTDGDVIVAAANERYNIGFLQNAPDNGKGADVAGPGGGSLAVAAGTITSGDFLKTDSSGHLVSIGTYEQAYAVAIAMDSAVDNDVFEVYVLPPGTLVTGQSGTGPVWLRVTATLAQINAGTTIVPAITGRKLYLQDFTAMPNGSFAAGTAIVLEDSTTGTDFVSIAQAQASDNAILKPTSTGVTLGTAFGDGGASGEGLKITKTGSDFTTATDLALNLLITYV